jgi:hypothetical protein
MRLISRMQHTIYVVVDVGAVVRALEVALSTALATNEGSGHTLLIRGTSSRAILQSLGPLIVQITSVEVDAAGQLEGTRAIGIRAAIVVRAGEVTGTLLLDFGGRWRRWRRWRRSLTGGDGYSDHVCADRVSILSLLALKSHTSLAQPSGCS